MSQEYEHTLADVIRTLMDFGSKNKTTLDTSPATDDAILWMQDNSEQVAAFVLQALATPQATEPASQPATGRYVVEIDPPGEMFTFSKIRDMQTGMLLDGVYLDEAEAQTEADRLNADSTGQEGE